MYYCIEGDTMHNLLPAGIQWKHLSLLDHIVQMYTQWKVTITVIVNIFYGSFCMDSWSELMPLFQPKSIISAKIKASIERFFQLTMYLYGSIPHLLCCVSPLHININLAETLKQCSITLLSNQKYQITDYCFGE